MTRIGRRALLAAPLVAAPARAELSRVGGPEALEEAARRVLPGPVADWIAGGAGGEAALRRSRAALEALVLTPRVLTGAGPADPRVVLPGVGAVPPIGIGPFGANGHMHPEAELATARGAAAAGALFVVPMVATRSLEEVAAVSGPRWLQLYLQADRGATRDLAQRARASGYGALVVTLTAPVAAWRERDIASGFALDPALSSGNDRASYARPLRGGTNPSPRWSDIEALQAEGLPVVLKGVLRAEDAARAAAIGAAVFVSNHGGRQMESWPAPVEVLPRIADVVAGRVPVLMDGGIRRGEDALKALASGADAVFVARPAAWALAAGGAEGVRWLMDRLHAELATAMRLGGVDRLEDAPSLLR